MSPETDDEPTKIALVDHGPKEVTIGLVFSYVVGPLFLLGGISVLVELMVGLAAGFIAAGILTFPPTRWQIENRLGVVFTRPVLVLFVLVLLFGTVALSSPQQG